jgi:NADH-quinone oxidoreductase subunit J
MTASRLLVWITAVVLTVASFGVAVGQPVPAVPTAPTALPTGAPAAERPTGAVPPAAERPVAGPAATKQWAHGDRIESHDKGLAILFWLFAAASVAGALFVISRRNLIAAVMGMVGSFLGIAAIYMMLYASFLAVIQMLVYAGAIMVLFVFVIMILNRPEDEPVATTGRAGKVLGSVAILYLVGRLVLLLIRVHAPASSLAAPHALTGTPATQTTAAVVQDWGSIKAVGTDLFGNGLFPFETISILLLLAVVGAIAIARPLNETEPPEGLEPNDPRVEGHSV